MKRQITKVMSMVVLLVLAAVGTLAHGADRIVVNIPFDFFVGDKNVPAGEYTITKVTSASDRMILVRSADGEVAVIVPTNSIETGAASRTARLNFTRYDEQYFLAQIWTPGSREGREIPRSQRQQSLEREAVTLKNPGSDVATAKGTTVTVTGSVK